MKKRVFSALLALVLTLSAAVLPASAAESFSDVSDKKTAQNVEVLRLLGVVEGSGAGRFNPNGQLTRAEFCKMVVVLMGKGNDAMRYKTVTIFPDVRATYWAAGYINLAVRQSEPKLLAGLPDGTFQPDRPISYGEAVTILMRVLGFADQDTGGIWPDGYINLAKSSGVSAGVSLTGGATITRAQAAQLFVNVLSVGKDGKGYEPAGCKIGSEATLISLSANTIRVNVDGKSEKFDLVRPSSSSALNGLKGRLLTNGDGKVMTFVPKTSAATGAAVSSAAVILSADKSTGGISALTDGRTDYTIYRNGVLSSVDALRKNDVATYDAASNTVYVCDTRVTVYYESCEPSPSAPVSIKVLGGTQLNVLPTAQQSLSQFKPGKTMTLLLAGDGSVAGAVDGDYAARGNAIGVVSGGKVQLLCGSTLLPLTLTGMTVDSKLEGKLVSVSSSSKTAVGLYAKSGGVSGDLNVREGTLGGRKLASGVLIFDDGVLVDLGELADARIAQSRITYARTNGSGEVDLIALSSTTGEKYGRVTVSVKDDEWVWKDGYGDKESKQAGVNGHYETKEGESIWIWNSDSGPNTTKQRGVNGDYSTTTTVSVDCNESEKYSHECYYSVRSGDFVAFKENSGKTGFSQMLTLDKLSDVASTAWIGKTAVNYGGRTYTVSSDALCWNRDGGSWLDGGVEAALAYGGTMNLYVRDGVVRVLEVRG